MTERNFTVVIPGFYRTRNGDLAEVLQIMDARLSSGHPVWGLLHADPFTWTTDGFCYHPGREELTDIIEFIGAEKPKEKKMVKKTFKVWGNVYDDGEVINYATKELADYYIYCRIACVELTGEYQVEEDV